MTGLSDIGAGLLRLLDAETAHRLAVTALAHGWGVDPHGPADPPSLATRVGSLTLSSPVGLAAGFDKNAEALAGLAMAGFGFVECGSVTPRPQAGNDRPRLFRLEEDRAVINRMGFNNDGLDAFVARLDARPPGLIVGANLGANKDSTDRTADYVAGIRAVAGRCDYVTVNVSSPNTPGLRALQAGDALDDLLGRVAEARGAEPVFLKIAPDLTGPEIEDVVAATIRHELDGLIVSNTTLDRPPTLASKRASEAGGLSGAPLRTKARAALIAAAEAAEGRLPLIAAGGIDSGAEAWARIRLGASAVQIYSALIFEGPSLIDRIKRELAERLAAEGFVDIVSAVGAR